MRRTTPSASVIHAPPSPPPTFVTPLATLPPPYTSRADSVRALCLASSSRHLPPLHVLLRLSFISFSWFIGCRPCRLLGLFAESRCLWFTREGQALPLWRIAQLGSPLGLSLRTTTYVGSSWKQTLLAAAATATVLLPSLPLAPFVASVPTGIIQGYLFPGPLGLFSHGIYSRERR